MACYKIKNNLETKIMRNEKGFTLIELLVVVAIIGILAAIAIPQFSSYRERAFDAGARADLRNAANGEEAYFVDNDAYLSCADAACLEAGAIGLPGLISLSSDVTLTMVAVAGPPQSFTGTASAPTNGSGVVYTFDSANGGMQ